MRQRPDPRPPPPWLLVGTPTGFGPKLASRWAEHSLLMWMLQNIFDISCFILLGVCVLYFYDLSAWDGCWSLVSIWSIIYKFLNVCPISIARLLWEVGRLGARKSVNHTSWVADVTPTDRPKSARRSWARYWFSFNTMYFRVSGH